MLSLFFTVFFILAFKADYFKKKINGNGVIFIICLCLLVWGVLVLLEVDQGFISPRFFVVPHRPAHGSSPIARSASLF